MLDELRDDGYIDVLFLGASHTYRSYDVELIENNTELNVLFGAEGIVNGIFPFLHGFILSSSMFKYHLTHDYLNDPYQYVTYDNEAYYGQGFVYSYEAVSDDFVFNKGTSIDPNNLISDFSLKYLRKIIGYCRDNNIELILVNPPMPDGTLLAAENFQLYVEAIKSIAEENNLQYWDFNLIKNGVMTMERTDFKDQDHLNGTGAEKFSICISAILNGKIKNPFYSTYAEKIKYNLDNTTEKIE